MEEQFTQDPDGPNRMEQSAIKRLNKYIGETGFCSRREADTLIEEGRVTVNGNPAEMGMKVTNDDEVRIDGKLIREKNEKPVYLAFNKPPGIECTTNLEVKDNIIDFIHYPKRIFPIGRLDKASEGLIFMTNDGDIVNKILRARNNHEKEYTVTVNKPITSRFIDRMANGIPILDTVTRKCKVEQISKFTFKIILTQGLNRQIRRMCEFLDYEVTKLIRIRIINISLDIPAGRYRDLTDAEILELNQLIEPSSKTEEASLPKTEKRAPRAERTERAPSTENKPQRTRDTAEPGVKPYDKRKTDDKPFETRNTAERSAKPAFTKRNVEFIKKDDSKVSRDPENPAQEAEAVEAKRKTEFVKREDSKVIRDAKMPNTEEPNARKPETVKRKIEFIKKDDPDYKKKGDY